MPASVENLFECFRRGDPAALGEVFDRCAPDVLRVAMHLTRDGGEAEELVQATFLTAIEAAADWERGRPLLPWLMGILANQHRTLRWRQRRQPDPARLPRPQVEGPVEVAARHELSAALLHALDQLPDPYREVLVLHLAHGLTGTEIAHAQNRAPATVRSQIMRGLELVRRLLPAGFASAAVLGSAALLTAGGKGLAEVRATVMGKAATATPAAAGGAWSLHQAGALVMKNLAWTSAALLACAALLWFAFSPPGPATPASPPAGLAAGGSVPEAPPADLRPAPNPSAAAPPRTPLPEAATTCQLRGQLVDPEHRPAPGVRLDLTPTGDVRAERTTDAAGSFDLRVPRGTSVEVVLLDPRRRFVASRGDRVSLPVGDTAEHEAILVVTTVATVRGIVRERTGAALGQVEVAACPQDGEGHVGERVATATSRADGSFELAALWPTSYRLVTASPRHAPAVVAVLDLAPGEARDDVRFELDAGATIAGHVVDQDGRRAGGLRVGIERTLELAPGITRHALREEESVTAEPDGSFVVGGVTAARATLRAFGAGFVSGDPVEALAGATSVVLTVRRCGSVRGRVQDAGGAPLADVEIRAGRAGGVVAADGPGMRARTEADGRFHLVDVPPGAIVLRAEATGYLATRREVVVEAGREVEVALDLRQGARLEVTVVDGEGVPLADATVHASTPPHVVREGPHGQKLWSSEVPRAQGRTGADGRVTLAGLPAGSLRVRADRDAMLPATDTLVDLAEDDTAKVTVTLVPGAFLLLRSQGTDGAPLPRAAFAFRAAAADADEPRQGNTDARGEERLGPLAPGRYTAWLQFDSGRRQGIEGTMTLFAEALDLEASRRTVELRPGEERELCLVRPALASLSGRVFAGGGAVAGVLVELLPVRTDDRDGRFAPLVAPYHAETDHAGTFHLRDVAPGHYLLLWGREGAAATAEQRIEVVDATDLRFDLTLPAGSLALELRAGGAPVAGALARLTPLDHPQRRQGYMVMSPGSGSSPSPAALRFGGGEPRSDAQGRLALGDLPAGRYRLEVTHPDFVAHRVDELAIPETGSLRLSPIQLAPGGSVRAQVVAADGGEVLTAFCELRPTAGGATVGRAAPRGSLSLRGLAPGHYGMRARAFLASEAGAWSAEQAIEVVAGAETAVRIVLPR